MPTPRSAARPGCSARRRLPLWLLASLVVGLGLTASAATAWSQDKPPASVSRPTSRRPYASGGVHLAIERGLCWLARHQDETGRWSGATCAQACEAVDPKAKPCQPETALEGRIYSTQADVGGTALALLAFIRAGQGDESSEIIEDPVNKRRLTIGADVVHKGLTWLVSQQRPDGSFSDAGTFFLYNEAIATLTLCEAYGLTRREDWKVPAQKAVDFLCKAQKPNPADPTRRWGWRYLPAGLAAPARDEEGFPTDTDTSVTGWMVMALKSARAAGLEVPQAALDGALDFTRWSTGKGGLVGYLGPDSAGLPIVGEHDNFVYHVGTMTSIGMSVRIAVARDAEDPFLLQAADRLMLEVPTAVGDPEHPQIDYYYWYYGTLALNQLDGPDGLRRPSKYAAAWNKVVTDTVLDLQSRTKGDCSLGGWMKPDRWSFGFGPVYTTAMSVLCLEVCYRY